jgi:N-acetylglucosamine transport system substrate-binding protein
MKNVYALVAGICVLALAGCGSSPSAANAPGTADSDANGAKEAPTGSGKLAGDLEVQAFKGGFGLDFYQDAAKEFQAKNPDVHITVGGDPDVATALQPRLVNGDPPDLMYPGWKLDIWGLVDEGQLSMLDNALDSPAYDGTGKWRDTFLPDILKLGTNNGKQYMLPYFFNIWGWWYNPDLFAQNGWTVPKNYDELLALCAKIKAKGIAPMTFQGKYPYYMLEGMILPWVQDIGGPQAVKDLQNLKPGAWKSPAVLKAVSMIKDLKDKGFFQDGAVGLSHTESQTEFLHNHAAMIPCGTWLYTEMQKVIPPGAKMQFMQPPAVSGGAGDGSAVLIDIEPWMVPAAAKQPNLAVAFYKYMTSLPEAKKFVEEKGSLTSIKGSDDVKLPETLVEPSKAYKAAKLVWCFMNVQWYKKMETEVENALTSMLNAQITPEQFCDRAEKAAEAVRQDSTITKHKVD